MLTSQLEIIVSNASVSSLFEGMFGGNIWKHAVLVFTFLPRDEKSVKKRERIRKKSDDKFAQEW